MEPVYRRPNRGIFLETRASVVPEGEKFTVSATFRLRETKLDGADIAVSQDVERILLHDLRKDLTNARRKIRRVARDAVKQDNTQL